MPWFPDFASAVELARQQTRAAGQADPVAQYFTALNKGDAGLLEDAWPGEVVVYDPRAGAVRGPFGPHDTHRGTADLRSFFTRCFSAGGGIGLQHCAVTDDGVRCALEYNCLRWGRHDLPPQAGLGVYERNPDGCWPRPASTTTLSHPSGIPEAGYSRLI